MEFSRQVLAWVPYPPPDLPHAGTELGSLALQADLPHAGTELGSPALQADSLPCEPLEEPRIGHRICHFKMSEEKMNVESY